MISYIVKCTISTIRFTICLLTPLLNLPVALGRTNTSHFLLILSKKLILGTVLNLTTFGKISVPVEIIILYIVSYIHMQLL